MKYSIPLLIILLSFSCRSDRSEITDPQVIIDKTIERSGSNIIANSEIQFRFRDKSYRAKREQGIFELVREFEDSTGVIKDVLSNTGLQRFRNETLVLLEDIQASKYASSVNSVHYFAVLPYGLNDSAVKKRYLGMAKINDQNYYKIEISFHEEGGGEDFEDVFIYWINKSNFYIDYLAYSYNEEDGIGIRFREAFNERFINGTRIVDYKNYKPNKDAVTLNDLDTSFERGELKLLSKIILEDFEILQ